MCARWVERPSPWAIDRVAIRGPNNPARAGLTRALCAEAEEIWRTQRRVGVRRPPRERVDDDDDDDDASNYLERGSVTVR